MQIDGLPAGIEEDQMRGFLAQFGTVTRLALKRDKFGRSQRRAYVEFDGAEIAEIAAESVDGGLMYGTLVRCRPLAAHAIDSSMFLSNPLKIARLNRKKETAKAKWYDAASVSAFHMSAFNDDAEVKGTVKEGLLKDESCIRDSLKRLGIEYDFGGFEALLK
jgi:RNA recognition motif-containing protein